MTDIGNLTGDAVGSSLPTAPMKLLHKGDLLKEKRLI